MKPKTHANTYPVTDGKEAEKKMTLTYWYK